jgi:hypothetical protein
MEYLSDLIRITSLYLYIYIIHQKCDEFEASTDFIKKLFVLVGISFNKKLEIDK